MPVTIPTVSALSPQVSCVIAVQTSSSCSSEAEEAELAGASMEDSTEIKRNTRQQVKAGRRSEEPERRGSHEQSSTEEDDDEGNISLHQFEPPVNP